MHPKYPDRVSQQKRNSPRVSRFPNKRKSRWTNFRWTKKNLFLIIGVMVALFLLAFFSFYTARLYALAKEEEKVEMELSEYIEKEERLRDEKESWQKDCYIEQKARLELGLARPGETVIIIED